MKEVTTRRDALGLLQGRVALVTGAARGIGLGIAQCLARQGASVVLADLDGDALGEAAASLVEEGHGVRTVTGNVAIAADVSRMVETAVEAFGRLDVLVNNAGGSAYTPSRIEDVTEADYDKVLDWNVRGTFLCIKTAVPALKESRGTVINLASMSGQIGMTLFSPQYSASKAAIIGLTRNLAKHLGPHGIRVNAIAPGVIRSGERFDAIWESGGRDQMLDKIPLGRVGDLSELADVALFLACDLSRYVTGSVVNVDGGFLCA